MLFLGLYTIVFVCHLLLSKEEFSVLVLLPMFEWFNIAILVLLRFTHKSYLCKIGREIERLLSGLCM